ncbi:MAG: hypothetical protein JF607_03475 [Burkholderiales bacterium]|nr:hypothetical protein [Burkholderiales bacterium]
MSFTFQLRAVEVLSLGREDIQRHRRAGVTNASLVLACALTLGLMPGAHAQSPENLLRGLVDSAKQARKSKNTPQEAAPAPAATNVSAADLVDGAPSPAVTNSPVPLPTRQTLLAATESGQFIALNRAGSEERKKLVASVQRVLMAEYKVPAISPECYEIGGFAADVSGLLSDIGEVNAITLSDQPPDFTNTQVNRARLVSDIDRRLSSLQAPRDRTHCDGESMGRMVPHPYKAALVRLAGDYAKATQAYVEAERTRRQTEYRETQARQQQEQQQRQAEARAAEQQRIDAEAARIKAEQEKRAKKEKSRVAG